MLNFEVLPTPISLRVRTLIAATWLVPWQDLASGCLCATIGANRLTIRTATSPHWFVLVDWNGGSIVVTEWADQAQLYRFSAMAAAFVFVDALLTSHLSKMTEQPQTPADIPAAAEFRPQFEGPLDRVSLSSTARDAIPVSSGWGPGDPRRWRQRRVCGTPSA